MTEQAKRRIVYGTSESMRRLSCRIASTGRLRGLTTDRKFSWMISVLQFQLQVC